MLLEYEQTYMQFKNNLDQAEMGLKSIKESTNESITSKRLKEERRAWELEIQKRLEKELQDKYIHYEKIIMG